jgi:DNA-binding protein H-NS
MPRIEQEKRDLERRIELLMQRMKGDRRVRPSRVRRPYPKVLPKFRNPHDPSITWSGRGKQPRWLTELLAEGTDMEGDVVLTEMASGGLFVVHPAPPPEGGMGSATAFRDKRNMLCAVFLQRARQRFGKASIGELGVEAGRQHQCQGHQSYRYRGLP